MKIVIITHCSLAEAYCEVVKNFISISNNVDYIGIDESIDIDEKVKQLIKKYAGNSLDDICFITDLIISSSTNIAYRVAREVNNSSVITGANLKLIIDIILNDEVNNQIIDDARSEIRKIKDK